MKDLIPSDAEIRAFEKRAFQTILERAIKNRDSFLSLGWDFEIIFESFIIQDGNRTLINTADATEIEPGYESMICVYPTYNGAICDFLEYGFMSTLNTIVECKADGVFVKKKKIRYHEDYEMVFLKGLEHLLSFLENKPIYKEYPEGNAEFLSGNPEWAKEMIQDVRAR